MPIDSADPNALRFTGQGSGVDATAGMPTTLHAGRRDGRTALEMRPLSLSHSPLSCADGSARLRVGLTDVVAAAYGPLDCPPARQSPEGMQVSVSFRRREREEGGGELARATEMQGVIAEAVVAAVHPRKAVVVAVQVLVDGGGVVAAAVNASVVALMEAGVPMRAVPTAACVALGGGMVVDPVRVEEVEAEAVVTVVFDTERREEKGFVAVHTEGDCGGEKAYEEGVETCRELATKTRAFLKLSFEHKVRHQCAWNSAST